MRYPNSIPRNIYKAYMRPENRNVQSESALNPMDLNWDLNYPETLKDIALKTIAENWISMDEIRSEVCTVGNLFSWNSCCFFVEKNLLSEPLHTICACHKPIIVICYSFQLTRSSVNSFVAKTSACYRILLTLIFHSCCLPSTLRMMLSGSECSPPSGRIT